MSTTYGNDIVYCLKSHCGVRGRCRKKWVLQVQVICKFSNERTCKRNKDVQGLSCGFEDKLKYSYPIVHRHLRYAIINSWHTLNVTHKFSIFHCLQILRNTAKII